MNASLPSPQQAETTLDRLAPGASGLIQRLNGDRGVTRRLMELGFVPGTRIVVVRRAPLGDPIELEIREVHISIRRSEAMSIHVTPD